MGPSSTELDALIHHNKALEDSFLEADEVGYLDQNLLILINSAVDSTLAMDYSKTSSLDDRVVDSLCSSYSSIATSSPITSQRNLRRHASWGTVIKYHKHR